MLKDEAFTKRRREAVLQVVVPAHTKAGRCDLAALSKRQRTRQGVWNDARPWAARAENEQGRDLSLPRCVFGKTSRGGVER